MSAISELFASADRFGDGLAQGMPWVAPALQTCRLSIKAENLNQSEEVKKRVHDFVSGGHASGWIETTDRVQLVVEGALPGLEHTLLNAELVHGQTSLHLRQIDATWSCVTLTEASADGPNAELVSRKTTLASAERGAGAFDYRVYSRLTEDGRLEDVAARLVGIGKQ